MVLFFLFIKKLVELLLSASNTMERPSTPQAEHRGRDSSQPPAPLTHCALVTGQMPSSLLVVVPLHEPSQQPWEVGAGVLV